MRSFRMDDRKQRLIVDSSMPEGQHYFGWEVANAKALDKLAGRLDAAGDLPSPQQLPKRSAH